MNLPRKWSVWLPPALLMALLWAILAGLFAAQIALTGNLAWEESLRRAVGFWLPWLFLLPISWLFSRFVLNRQIRPVASVLLHLVACGVVVAAGHYLSIAPDPPPRPGGPDGSQPNVPGQRPPRGEFGGPPWNRGPRPGPVRQDSDRPRGLFGPFGFRSIIDIIVYGGVVSLAHSLAFLRRSQQRERRALELEASLAKAKLEALRLQINPHFLFNTLNAIASLIHTRPEAADEMIGSLSDLLRASLHGAGDHEVPLGEELEILRLFTDIERTRFGDRILFLEHIDPETRAAFVPSLILQPLVENSIRHGLEPRTGHGSVQVLAHRDGDSLILTIRDDGVGFDPLGSAASKGIGLANTRDRLRALYGDRQSLHIEPASGRGTIVTVTLPWHTSPA